MTYAAFALLW